MELKALKGEDAIEKLADIIEPLADIAVDTKIREMWNGTGVETTHLISYILKTYKKQIVFIMATLDGVDPSEYTCNILTLPQYLLEIVNDPNISALFPLFVQSSVKTASGSATDNTKGTEAK